MSIPGLYRLFRRPEQPAQSSCGCLVVAAVSVLILVGGLLAAAWYAAYVLELGWRHR